MIPKKYSTVNVKRRRKGHEGKVDARVYAMVQLYNKYMKESDLSD